MKVSEKPSDAFLKEEGGKARSNALETPSLSLPNGGGAIKGIDEKFSVNAVNGTASLAIPLPFSTARGSSPTLNLSYNSGGGNGIFGLGWGMNLASIKRKTENELPRYHDAFASDTFLFSQGEDLVPEYEKEPDGSLKVDAGGDYIIREKDSADGAFTVRFYKPRIEGLFSRIERWSDKTSGEIRWRVISKENVTTLFGWTAASRISDPEDAGRIFEWLPEFVFDDKGNCTRYLYKKEDEAGFDPARLHNRNRLADGDLTYTNTYLTKVLYGNKTPYKVFGAPFPVSTDFMFETIFDFGEYRAAAPYDEVNEWSFRPDAFSSYKAGFEIRTTRLCRRVLLVHHFAELPGGAALVRSLDFEYEAGPTFTFLTSITSRGYIKRADGSYTNKALPPLEFAYQKPTWNKEIKTVLGEALVHGPAGLTDQYQFTDLFSEGLAGILTEQAAGWYYKHNLGNGEFERAKLVSSKPSFIGLASRLQLTDLDGDGSKQIVSYGGEPKGFFELDDDDEWLPFKRFDALPNIDLTNPNTRLLDLSGDGTADILITEDQVFSWYQSKGRNGFYPAGRIAKPLEEESGPRVVFAESKQTIFLADMNGDGMVDIVRIRNGEVCYWPNMGYGKFGTKTALDNAPVFDQPDAFNPALIRLADIDGSGSADIIYLGKNKVNCWMNQSGNGLGATPFEIDPFPGIRNQSAVTVVDLLGNGVPCIVYSSDLEKDANAPLKFVDLMDGKKPHIMLGYKNNLGKEIALEYAPSTSFYIEDKLAGRPWATKLHFPVHCVVRAETIDRISGLRFVSSYKYHHGYFDHPEKEFRGFGMVEQTDAEHFEHWVKGTASNIVDEALHQAPVLTRSWFHTGAFLGRESILTQFAGEYWYEEMTRRGFAVVNDEASLPDARIIAAPGVGPATLEELGSQEWREALRSCKGMSLRSEVFALDAPLAGATAEQIKKELTPFAVTAQNCLIELLQPRGKNKHAVFVVKGSEALTYKYERAPEDPRVSHTLNIRFDEYANVLESASVVYPKAAATAGVPSETQEAQARTLISYVQSSFTNDIETDDEYRLRVPSEVKTYELKGVAPSGTLYSVADFENVLAASGTVAYHELEEEPAAGASQKRLLEHVRNTFYRDDLTGPLPLHQMGAHGLLFENYQLAYTPALITDIFGARVNAAVMLEGKFTHSEGDDDWWVRSGSIQFIEGLETSSDAEDRFYLPISYIDPYGAKTKVKYFSDYFLLVEETEDALQNTARVLTFNLRTLSPQRIQDANDNISEVLTDELGMVKAQALFGKGAEADDLIGLDEFTSAAEAGTITNFFSAATSDQLTATGKDLLRRATMRFLYDLNVYKNSGGTRPAVAAAVVRERHFNADPSSPVQLSFEYSNGLGQVVMKKVQAEPGPAKKVTLNPDDTYTVSLTDTSASVPKQLRWIGNGRRVLNNKGNPVKQYEPYFSVTHRYEELKELVETGVTPLLHYDALGRVVRTDAPNQTFTKTEFDSWKQSVYDQNDTVADSAWYDNRFNHLIDAEVVADGKDPAKEKLAAERAAKHHGTPLVQHFDTLGRPILQIEHNRDGAGADQFYTTIINTDIEDNLRSVTDARGNLLVRHKYDMLGNLVYRDSADTGERFLVHDIAGNPLREWDERNHEHLFEYDILRRLISKKVKGGDGPSPLDHTYEKILYGEGAPGDKLNNLRTRPVTTYDTAGKVSTPGFDFKGNPVSHVRAFARAYKEVADWNVASPDALLETETFVSSFEYDGLNRLTLHTTPDNSVYEPAYNEAGLLEQVRVTQNTVTEFFVRNIDYNEKGQRSRITYGNDVTTRYFYDRETFKLIRLETKRQNNDPLQDVHYTFDAVGNITHIEDRNIPEVFFNNQQITGVSSFIFDALYRLAEATGREHAGHLSFGAADNWNDQPFIKPHSQGDPMAWRNYTQRYEYDEVGNILKMQHIAGPESWVRNYTYAAGNNRLLSSNVGADTYTYPHHARHGFITALPHLQVMKWNFREELQAASRQSVTSGTPEMTWYVYDGGGQRVRKVTENQAPAGVDPTRKSERLYVGGIEVYREYGVGGVVGLERKSLHVVDDKKIIAMIETRTLGADDAPPRLVRYQFSNDVGSTNIETDQTGRVISYEEYHPYGTTSYQATDKDIKAAAKRYRYTGAERDEESGLEYHSARYYLPWLGRWMSADPIGLRGGANSYAYARDNPIMIHDPSGRDGESCGVWDEDAGVCYAEPCPMETRTEAPVSTPSPTPPPPPRVRVARRQAAPPPPPPPPPPPEPAAPVQQEVSAWQRWGIGGLQLLGCGLEGAITVGLCVAPDPTLLTKIGCGVGAVHTADTCQAAVRTLATGTVTQTFTHQAGEAGALELGATPDQARWAGTGFDLVAGAGPSLGVGIARRVTASGAEATISLATRPGPVISELVESGGAAASRELSERGVIGLAGHNKVGIQVGEEAVQWFHLAGQPAAEFGATIAPNARYIGALGVEIGVSAQAGQRALATVSRLQGAGEVTWSVFGPNCATAAAQVLRSGGVILPAGSSLSPTVLGVSARFGWQITATGASGASLSSGIAGPSSGPMLNPR